MNNNKKIIKRIIWVTLICCAYIFHDSIQIHLEQFKEHSISFIREMVR